MDPNLNQRCLYLDVFWNERLGIVKLQCHILSYTGPKYSIPAREHGERQEKQHAHYLSL